MVFEAFLVEHLPDRRHEAFDVGIALLLLGVQAVLDEVVGIVFKIFERKVFEFAFQFIKPEFMRQLCEERGSLGGHALLLVGIFRVANAAHKHYALGNEEQHHAHIARLGDEEVAEIVGLHGLRLALDTFHAEYGAERGGCVQSEHIFHRLTHLFALFRRGGGIDHEGRERIAAQPYLGSGEAHSAQCHHKPAVAERVAQRRALGIRLFENYARLFGTLRGRSVVRVVIEFQQKTANFPSLIFGVQVSEVCHRRAMFERYIISAKLRILGVSLADNSVFSASTCLQT